MALQNLELLITGMTCAHCENTVTNAIKNLDGIRNLNVSYQSGHAFLVFDNASVTPENIVDAVNETEVYQASVINSRME